MAFVKLEQYEIVERRNGCVYKTKKVGAQWFPLVGNPCGEMTADGKYMWVSTTDYHFGKIEDLPRI